jgi:hypothetical protein
MKPLLIRVSRSFDIGESHPVYVNANAIQHFEVYGYEGTMIVFTDSSRMTIDESPEVLFQVITALNK